MNLRRAAAALRELADALEEGEGDRDVKPENAPKPRRRPRLVPPPGEVTDLDRARAERAMSKAGLVVRRGGKK